MRWNKMINKITLLILISLGLILTGCGGSDSTTALNNGGGSGGQTVSLTGVVVSGTTANGVAVGVLSRAVASGVPLANALVIASDKFGNTETTTADRAGNFTLALTTGSSYALIFLDTRTLQVVGSLVQAANTASAGALSLDADSDLGAVVVNQATGKALSINDVNGTLSGVQVIAAPAGLDADGDGIVTQDEISSAQASAVSTGNATAMSVVDFFAKPGTWSGFVETWNDPTSGASGADYGLAVADIKRVSGANGAMVDAVKSSQVVYWNTYSDANGSVSGYYDPTGVNWYGVQTYAPPPATFDMWAGPMTWAQVEYPDATAGFMMENSNIGDPYSSWRSNVPLTIKLNTLISNTFTTFDGTEASSFTVNIAQENGAAYVFTDTSGLKHPVVYVTTSWTWTPDPTNCQGCTANSGSEAFYVVAGYGVANIPAVDANGATLTPSAAIAAVQFGKISGAGATLMISDENPLATTTPQLTTLQRDEVLAYVWAGRDKAGEWNLATAAASAAPTDYFFANWDVYGQVLSPVSWNAATSMPNYLASGAATQSFTANVSYLAAAGATFKYEFRASDATGSPVVLTSSANIVLNAAVAETAADVVGVIAVPTIANLPADYQWSYIDWQDGTTTINEGYAVLHLLMLDGAGNVIMETPLEYYTIR